MQQTESALVAPIQIHKIAAGSHTVAEDHLAVEEPLEIQVTYVDEQTITKSIAVTMRTPGNDEELAAGFLFTEGILHHPENIATVSTSLFNNNTIQVVLKENIKPSLQNTERNFYTTSSCGVCGKSSIDAIRTKSAYANEKDNLVVNDTVFYNLPTALREQQVAFDHTGGLHASALFDLQGNFITLREDVGRHNALDKVIGAAFIEDKLPLKNTILLLSGRASFELLQKASMAGIKIVAAIGAPSTVAVQLAEEFGITLIGFLRNERFNIYSGAHRVRFTKEEI